VNLRPVITVQKFSDEAEALAWANGVDYGLASSCGPATRRAMRFTRDLDFGCVWVTHISARREMPTGDSEVRLRKDLSSTASRLHARKHVMHNIES